MGIKWTQTEIYRDIMYICYKSNAHNNNIYGDSPSAAICSQTGVLTIVTSQC